MSSFALDGKTVFVTGGTGTIGGQVVRELLSQGSRVIVYSRDQNKQFKMAYDISSKRVTYKNGDICDYELLKRSMSGSDYVIHCAASKHVPLCEENVDSAIKVNVNGTRNVLEACVHNGVQRFILLSTDKAVDPVSVMGATKFLAERLTLDFSTALCASVVRLGNIFASNGSVVPTFRDRIKDKLKLVVTSTDAVRFFLTQKDAASFIVERMKETTTGRIYLKKMKRINIYSLAEIMGGPGYPIEVTYLGGGEKIDEALYAYSEFKTMQDHGGYLEIHSETPGPHPTELFRDEFYTRQEIIEMLKD